MSMSRKYIWIMWVIPCWTKLLLVELLMFVLINKRRKLPRIINLSLRWIYNFQGATTDGLTLFQPGGVESIPPPGFSLAIATKINRSTPNFLTFNFYYRDINWLKIKLITCQGVTWSLFCRKHFVSPHIFHCIFTEFSCSTFSFSDIYIQC